MVHWVVTLVVTLDSTLVDQLFGTLVGMFYTLISMMIGTYQYAALMLIGTADPTVAEAEGSHSSDHRERKHKLRRT